MPPHQELSRDCEHLEVKMAQAECARALIESGPSKRRYEKLRTIGRGGYGVVYEAKDVVANRIVAIKKITSDAARDSLMNEIEILKALSHKSIIEFVDSFSTKSGKVSAVETFAEGGSLTSVIGKCGSMSEPLAAKYMRNVLDGLAYLHERGIVHLDIKSANILLQDQKTKLADFGLAVELSDVKSEKGSSPGSPYYIAPEVLLNHTFSDKSDIWSIGITTIELLKGQPPFSKMTLFQILAFFREKRKVPIPDGLSQCCSSFIQQCLSLNPEDRPTAVRLLSHPWITRADLDQETESSNIAAEEAVVFLSVDAYFNSSCEILCEHFANNSNIERLFLARNAAQTVVSRIEDPAYQINSLLLAFFSISFSETIAKSFVDLLLIKSLHSIFASSGGGLPKISAFQIACLSVIVVPRAVHSEKTEWLFEGLKDIDCLPFAIPLYVAIQRINPDVSKYIENSEVVDSLIQLIVSMDQSSIEDSMSLLVRSAHCACSPPLVREIGKHVIDQALLIIHTIASANPTLFASRSDALSLFLRSGKLGDSQICDALKCYKPCIENDIALPMVEGAIPTFVALSMHTHSGVSESALKLIQLMGKKSKVYLEKAARAGLHSALPKLMARPSSRPIVFDLIRAIPPLPLKSS